MITYSVSRFSCTSSSRKFVGTYSLMLAMFDPEQEITVEVDASDYAIGACISQKGKNGDNGAKL